jgi:hypothetical protein
MLNCSTPGGNSVSSVIDLESNRIIGLHVQGSYLETNPLLKKAEVNFV